MFWRLRMQSVLSHSDVNQRFDFLPNHSIVIPVPKLTRLERGRRRFLRLSERKTATFPPFHVVSWTFFCLIHLSFFYDRGSKDWKGIPIFTIVTVTSWGRCDMQHNLRLKDEVEWVHDGHDDVSDGCRCATKDGWQIWEQYYTKARVKLKIRDGLISR